MTTLTLPPRNEIPRERTWNRESVFASDADWQAELEAISADVAKAAAYEGRLREGPTVLAAALEMVEDLQNRTAKVVIYAGFAASVDSNDQAASAMVGQAQGVAARVRAALAYINPELLAVGQITLEAWVSQEPRLAIYNHMIDTLFRQQAHVRSAEVEQILGMVSDPLNTAMGTYGKLVNADFTFAPAITSQGEALPVAQGTIKKLMHDPDREARRTAWESYADTFLGFKNTLANSLLTAVKRDVFYTRVRQHENSLEASLFPNNIPVEVFHNLIDTFKQHLPTWHRYWDVRRRALGVETLHSYDVWAPIAANPPQVTYEQSVDWISAGLEPLGADYVEALQRGCLEQRWVDVYPNQGKRDGAFSWGTQGTHPFIMMSYTDDLAGMSTLAHELGHSMHSYLTWQHQPHVYSGYSLFVAEVASNFNQAMTRAYLFDQQDDPDFQIALIEEAMDNFHRYFFIMPTLARFELEVHERVERGQGVTADDMIALMADLFSEGYGSAMQVDRERVGITWAQFGHLYANFYVFQYATGISGAHALARRILDGEASAVEDYLGFLSAGSSGYPLDVLLKAGVDLRTPTAVEETFGVMTAMIDRLEALAT